MVAIKKFKDSEGTYPTFAFSSSVCNGSEVEVCAKVLPETEQFLVGQL